jgi:NCS1 family nucleobase:cation symporter-1
MPESIPHDFSPPSPPPLPHGKKLLSSQLPYPSAWKLNPEPSTFAPNSTWSNNDMGPVPLDMCTWTTFNYISFWISDAANAPMWAFASSMLAIGLSWFVVLLRCVTDHRSPLMPTIYLAYRWQALEHHLGDRYGTERYYLSPTSHNVPHSSFGFWLSYFSVISRIVVVILIRYSDFCWFRIINGINTSIQARVYYSILLTSSG